MYFDVVLYDLQRGKLPYYVLPPGMASEAAGVALDDSEVQLNGALAFPEGISPVLTDVTHKSSKHDEEEPAILGDDCGTQDAKSNETVETDAAVLEPPSSECVCGPNKRAKTMSSNSG